MMVGRCLLFVSVCLRRILDGKDYVARLFYGLHEQVEIILNYIF